MANINLDLIKKLGEEQRDCEAQRDKALNELKSCGEDDSIEFSRADTNVTHYSAQIILLKKVIKYLEDDNTLLYSLFEELDDIETRIKALNYGKKPYNEENKARFLELIGQRKELYYLIEKFK